MNYNILPYASIEVLMQLTYYCRLYEASPYNMQIDRATFIALSLVKPKGLTKEEEQGEEEEEQRRATAPRWGKVRVLHTPYTPAPYRGCGEAFFLFRGCCRRGGARSRKSQAQRTLLHANRG